MLLGRCSARSFASLLLIAASAATAACSGDLPTPPRLATLSVASGNNQTGAVGTVLAQPLSALVEDQYGTPIEGAVVTWAVTSGNGVVTPVSDTTDASGIASTSLRLGGQLGVQTVAASISDLPAVSFVAMATAGPPAELSIAGGDGQSAAVGSPLPIPLQVKVEDAFNNPLAGVTIAFTVVTGGGTVSAATAVSDETGVAKVNWTLGATAGTQTVVAGYDVLDPVTFSATGLAQPAPRVDRPRP